MYMRGMQVAAAGNKEVLATTIRSYFDRTWAHFCSHRQTPSSGKSSGPAVVRNGNVVYFAHPIFSQYNQNAPRWCKQLLRNAINLLLPDPLVIHNGPSTLLVSLNEQEAERRWIVHLLHYIPERRGEDFDILEDVIPLDNLTIALAAPQTAVSVRAVPGGEQLSFSEVGGRLAFVLPRLNGHQIIEIQF
jgi:hypothetical protein